VDLSDGTTVEGERLLVATRRRLDLRGLGVEAAGLDPDAPAVATDANLRAGDGIWAVGEVTGKGAFTHVAVYQGPDRRRRHPRHRARPSRLPRRAEGDVHRPRGRQRRPFGGAGPPGRPHGPGGRGPDRFDCPGLDPRSGRCARDQLVADANQGALVGGSAMGPAAGEIAGLLGLAIRERIPIAALRELIYPYPTFVRGVEDALRQL